MSVLQDLLEWEKDQLRRLELEYAEAETKETEFMLFGYKLKTKHVIQHLETKIKVYGDDGK